MVHFQPITSPQISDLWIRMSSTGYLACGMLWSPCSLQDVWIWRSSKRGGFLQSLPHCTQGSRDSCWDDKWFVKCCSLGISYLLMTVQRFRPGMVRNINGVLQNTICCQMRKLGRSSSMNILWDILSSCDWHTLILCAWRLSIRCTTFFLVSSTACRIKLEDWFHGKASSKISGITHGSRPILCANGPTSWRYLGSWIKSMSIYKRYVFNNVSLCWTLNDLFSWSLKCPHGLLVCPARWATLLVDLLQQMSGKAWLWCTAQPL